MLVHIVPFRGFAGCMAGELPVESGVDCSWDRLVGPPLNLRYRYQRVTEGRKGKYLPNPFLSSIYDVVFEWQHQGTAT